MGAPLTAKSVTLDAAGAGEVQLGPAPPFVRWIVTRLTVSAPNGGPTLVAKVYRNSVDPSAFLDGTYSGALDSADYPGGIDIGTGESLIVRWEGGIAGTLAVARAEGDAV